MELNGTGHNLYGPSLEVIWEELWSIYVYYVDLIWATALHIKPRDVSLFHSVVYCYGMTAYFVKVHTFSIAFCLGMVLVCPIAITYDPHLVLWDCYVFHKVPYNSTVQHRLINWEWIWECYGTFDSHPISIP